MILTAALAALACRGQSAEPPAVPSAPSVPTTSAPLAVPFDASIRRIAPDSGAGDAHPTDAEAPGVVSAHRVRLVYRGSALSIRTPEIRPALRGSGVSFRLGGMSMDYFGVPPCGACPSAPVPLGMPPDAPVAFADGAVLAEVGGGVVRFIVFGVCPAGARCTRAEPVPPGTYTLEIEGSFQCPATTLHIPVERDVTVRCTAAAGR